MDIDSGSADVGVLPGDSLERGLPLIVLQEEATVPTVATAEPTGRSG